RAGRQAARCRRHFPYRRDANHRHGGRAQPAGVARRRSGRRCAAADTGAGGIGGPRYFMSSLPSLPEPPSFDRHFDFSDRDFARVREMIHRRAGIALGEHKREMVYSRLTRRLRALGRQDFSSYLSELEAHDGAAEWENFVNALTTNLTAFFREPHHFPILAEYARKLSRPMSIWCAAASTGEEPYSIIITLLEALGSAIGDTHVLATDIDTQVLAKARLAVY